MRCRECGAILLETDTYCGKCGAKVEIDVCPECGEVLRPGMRFCAKCGHEVISAQRIADKQAEDDEIPVTGQISTTEIPFDIIEANIIRDVERQLDKKPVNKDSVVERPVTRYTSHTDAEIEKKEDTKDYEDIEYVEDSEEDYEEYEEDYEDDEFEEDEDDVSPPGLFSRLITAGMIVVGLILVLLVAGVFFNNRKNNKTVENEPETVQEQVTEEEPVSDGTIGTITIVKDVNIRDNPSTEGSNVIKIAGSGEEYRYYGYAENSANWVHIKVDDSTDGYVYKDFIQIVE